MNQEETKKFSEIPEFSDYGLWVDPNKIKECTHIVIWGQWWDPDTKCVGPWDEIMRLPVDTKRLKRKTNPIGIYISCEALP